MGRLVTITIPDLGEANAIALGAEMDTPVICAHDGTARLQLDPGAAKANTASRRARKQIEDALTKLELDAHPIYTVHPPAG